MTDIPARLASPHPTSSHQGGDIDGLIERAAVLIAEELGPDNVKRLQFREAATINVILEDIAGKVLALTAPAPPLPEEIAWLLDGGASFTSLPTLKQHELVRALASALQGQAAARNEEHRRHLDTMAMLIDMNERNKEQAAEIERLKALAIALEEESHRDFQTLEAELGGLNMGIAELEAELERQLQHCQTANADREHDAAEIERLEAECAAIRRKTIEECLSAIPGGNICDPQDIADRIRALPQSDEAKS